MPEYRFSGHETFTCRYAWLPKAVREVTRDPGVFWQDDEAMVRLGVGKNMVRAIRFWAEAAGVIAQDGPGKTKVTPFGLELLGNGEEGGLDPFLEDIRSLWLLHWRLSTATDRPLFAWDFLLNHWQVPELTASAVLKAFAREAPADDPQVTPGVLEQQFEIFIHTYVPRRGRKAEVREDNLDGPLVELEFLTSVGVRESLRSPGRVEPVYAFRRERKPEITPELFAYCVDDFWRTRHSEESTLTLPLLVNGHGGPGQVFKLPEDDLLRRSESVLADSDGRFDFLESAATPHLVRVGAMHGPYPLASVYQQEAANVG